MFILFVCLVSMNLLIIRTEEDIVSIDIKAGEQRDKCDVLAEVNLHKGKKFTLRVRSDYFIKKSFWHYKGSHQHRLQELDNSTFSITYKRTKSSGEPNNTIVYNYAHTGLANHKLGGLWNFTFELLTNYDPWSVPQNEDVQYRSCSTAVEIDPSKPKGHHSTTESPEEARSISDRDERRLLIAVIGVLAIIVFVQSSYVFFWRGRSCKSNRNNDKDPLSPKSPKAKRGSKSRRNIADRPPLPLPLDAVVKEEPMPPSPVLPMSPVPKRHLFPPSAPPIPVDNSYNGRPGGPMIRKQSYRNKGFDTSDDEVKRAVFARRPMEGPLVPKQSFRNKALDNSDEDLRSPGFARRYLEGPLTPKQSYRNKALDNSEEEIRTPSFARRHLEAKLVQLPPKAVAASKSIKLPKPLPRSSPTPQPEKAPAFQPAHRQVSGGAAMATRPATGVELAPNIPSAYKKPAPPLRPKNKKVFPPPALRRPSSIVSLDPRLSDDDWQYETLQPASKYLDNFNNIPYNIL